MNTTPPSPLHTPTPAYRRPGSLQDQTDKEATDRVPSLRHTSLVLHGGGAAGNAWEIGIIAGLFDAGLDVTRADLIIGTSAGATAAAQIASADPAELLAAILASVTPPQTVDQRPGSTDFRGRRGAAVPVSDHLERTDRIIAGAQNAADMRRRMGAAALEMDVESDGTRSAQWRRIVAARFRRHDWPQQPVLITAVDARTGQPVVFDRHSGVDLVDAVAASTSSGAPYWIGADRFIDGGYRRNENADLAAGYERVLVLSPFGGRSRHPQEWGMQLSAQVEELEAGGSSVGTIFPDRSSLDAFGDNMMDLATRPPAARAGYDQGRTSAESVVELWG